MSPLSAVFSANFPPIVLQTLISLISAIVFLFLDALDAVMCEVFRVLDQFLEGKSSSCYCSNAHDARNGASIGADGRAENQLSESLFTRRNRVREMNLVRFPNIRFQKREFWMEKGNRWSDCGCESCLSWMRNGADSRLHLIFREPERATPGNDSGDKSVENVIFIHGFLSSSSLWKETVFPNLSDHSKLNFRLFAVDLLGFGKSPKPRNSVYTLQDHLEMIEKSVILPYRMKSFHLVAHSMGCVITLALAAKYSASVKSVTLIAPPYFSSKGDASSEALRILARRRIWPPLVFSSAFMSWYEHLGRCACFFICRNHRVWEWVLKLLTRKRELHFSITDMMRHTHHSAWHTMHNVICGGAKLQDKYLEAITAAGVRIHVVQGTEDEVVPVECSYELKMKAPEIEVEVIPRADHTSVILGREKEFTSNLERLWASTLLV